MSLVRMIMRGSERADKVEFYIALSSLLNENRNDIVRHAMERECTHILWLDDDMEFPGDTLDCLLAHKMPIVGTNCVTRKQPIVTTAFIGNHRLSSLGKSGLEEVDGFGLAVCLTEVDVFKALPPPWFATPARPSLNHAPISEDVYFCLQARKHGYKIFVDHDVSLQIGHIGHAAFHHGLLAP